MPGKVLDTKGDYLYIRAWGKMLGSFPYYIQNEIEKARAMKAPETAIYYNIEERRWSTFEQIRNEDARKRVEMYVNELKRQARKEEDDTSTDG